MRTFAGQVLPKLSSVFDERLVREVVRRLDSVHAVVRKNAAEVLVTLTLPGAPAVADALLRALEDPDPEVRIAALRGLESQVRRGESRPVALVLQQLEHPFHEVRAAAARCLEAVAVAGDRAVITSLCSLLDDANKDLYGHFTVRPTALRALSTLACGSNGRMTPRATREAAAAALRQLGEDDWSLRRAAVQALPLITDCRLEPYVGRLISGLEDQNLHVRGECAAALASLFDPGDRWLSAVTALRLVISDSHVRATAAAFLQGILPGLPPAADAVLASVKRGRQVSGEDVLRLLEDTDHSGNKRALDGFAYSLDHPSDAVRQLAHDSLVTLTPSGYPATVELFLQRLDHPAALVRRGAVKALARVASQGEESTVAALIRRLDDEDREVVVAAAQAAAALLPIGDRRLLLVNACVHLDPDYSTREERTRALQDLGRTAYAAIHLKLQGTSVEDADLHGFWQLINLPGGSSGERAEAADDVLRRILRSFTDCEWWVRRAAVEAARECARGWDAVVGGALEAALADRSLAVRAAAVHALADLGSAGGSVAVLLLARLDDDSRVVRLAASHGLRRFARPGDRGLARALMTWLRVSWRHARSRGDDTEVKLQLAGLVLDVLLFRDVRRREAFLAGLRSDSVHLQRNAVAAFEEHLTEQGLIEPFAWHLYDAEHPPPEDADSADYGIRHWRAALLIQRLSRRHRRPGLRRKSAEPWHTRLRAGSQLSSGGLMLARERSGTTRAPMADHRRREDDIAYKILCLRVPLEVRSAAITTAQAASVERRRAGEFLPWDRMRPTERLRLCEEVAGRWWAVPLELSEEFGV